MVVEEAQADTPTDMGVQRERTLAGVEQLFECELWFLGIV
jgi:hypothetical protein